MPELQSSILKNIDALSQEFVPDELLHRDRELKEIMFSVSAFSRYGRHESLFLYGPTGVGKTASAQFVSGKALAELSGIDCLYINCWKDHTRMSVLNELGDKLGLVLPRRGIAVDELYSRIETAVSRLNKKLFIILDEADRLIYSKYSRDSLLYDLVRMKSSNVMLCMVSNDDRLPYNLDERIRSSLNLKAIKFKQYTTPELKDILFERAKLALFPGSYDNDCIGLIAAIAAKRGDARVAISLLREAAIIAERSGKKSIQIEHVRQAQSQLVEFKQREYDETEKQIIEVIRKAGVITAGKLYASLPELNERTIRNKLETLVKTGVLLQKETRVGRGRAFEYSLNQEKT